MAGSGDKQAKAKLCSIEIDEDPGPGTQPRGKGYTPLEAAEMIELPDELGRKWHNRGYHSTLHHDVRAVYTEELGMWDCAPVSLHPHTPADSARRYVDLIGAAHGRRTARLRCGRLPVGRRDLAQARVRRPGQ